MKNFQIRFFDKKQFNELYPQLKKDGWEWVRMSINFKNYSPYYHQQPDNSIVVFFNIDDKSLMWDIKADPKYGELHSRGDYELIMDKINKGETKEKIYFKCCKSLVIDGELWVMKGDYVEVVKNEKSRSVPHRYDHIFFLKIIKSKLFEGNELKITAPIVADHFEYVHIGELRSIDYYLRGL